MFKFIINHRRMFSAIFFIIALVLIVLPQLLYQNPLFCDVSSRIELLYYSSQVVSAIFVILGVIVAVWQYYTSSSKKISEMNYSRIEKAIELCNYYKDNVLTKYSFVKCILDECGITDMLMKKRKTIEIKDFDKIELEQLYTDEEIKKFENLFHSRDFFDAIVKYNQICNCEIKGIKQSIISEEDGILQIKTSVHTGEVVNDFYKTYIAQTLNNAEYFAMSFTHMTADHSVVYQSIYPTFLEMCFVMYYFISKNSDPSISKLYTNIAELYCIWRKKEQSQKEKLLLSARTAGNEKGNIVEV